MESQSRGRSIRVLSFAVAILALSLGNMPAQAKVIESRDYPFTQSTTCIPNPSVTCMAIPAGANKAVITFVDDYSQHVSGEFQVECGTTPNTELCTEFTIFCDSVEVVFPSNATKLYVAYDSVPDATGSGPCGTKEASGTTGTVSVWFR
jgi:hypothetical protein